MILVDHPKFEEIVDNYSSALLSEFIEKQSILLKLIDILSTPGDIDTISDVKANTKALKVLLNVKNLKKPKKITKKPETEALLFNINTNKINSDKRSKCRKFNKFEDLKSTINNLIKEVKRLKLFSEKPSNLLSINKELEGKFKLNTMLYEYFFDYTDYYKHLNELIANQLGVICCPYCNRNYITYIHENGRLIGPSYDHYFDKKKHIFLTLSFYNLIPSCYICNSNLKGSIKFELKTHLHPYLNSFDDDAYFDCEIKIINWEGNNKRIFEPTIIPKEGIVPEKKLMIFGKEKDIKGEVTGSVKVFKLKEIYSTHWDVAEELYEIFDKQSPHYIGSIESKLKELNVTEEELYRFHFRNYYKESDFHKRPLAKLNKDLFCLLKESQINPINKVK